MINWSIWFGFEKWVFQNLGFLVKTHLSSQLLVNLKNWTSFCALEHASYAHSLHASFSLLFVDILCALTLSNAVCPFFFLRVMVRKTRAKKNTTSFSSNFQCSRFQFKSNQEAYEKLNIFRSVWVERKVTLFEVNHEIHRNFESWGWLPLLDVEDPPLAALIKEIYSNLSIHFDDSNIHYVKTWIKGEELVITREVVASDLDVPLVRQLVYPYIKFPPIDDIMSLLTGTTISWGTNPMITTHELTELSYLFFRIFCHSIWPISHIHTIPIERCAFLYALITDAPINFPTLFIRSLVKVHRSCAKSYGLFSQFLYIILLDLGLKDFPTSKLVHVIAPIGATFLGKGLLS